MTIRTLCIALPCLLVGWIAILSMVALKSDAAPAYVVLFPSDGLLNEISEEASILSVSKFSVTLTSDETGFARSLYNSGALVVLPAGLAGCLPVTKST